jgi:PAS domain S-box-containing protein
MNKLAEPEYLIEHDISYQELVNINKVNQAVFEDKSLQEIARIYLDSIESSFSVKSGRLYKLENNQLDMVCENIETNALKTIEERTGIKIKNQIPVLHEDNYLYQKMKALRPIITSDPQEIRLLVEAHTTNSVLKTFSKWAISLLGLKTYGLIPLLHDQKIIGLVTFISSKVFNDAEKESFLRYTSQISIGLIKKISNELLIEQKKLSDNIFDILPIDLAIYDKNNRYTFVNKNAIKNDQTRNWIIGKTDEEYCAQMGKDKNLAEDRTKKLRQVEKTGKPLQWIEHLVDADANQLYFMRIIKPVIVDQHVYKIGYGIDVSDLVNTQEKLKETQKIGKLGSWELSMINGKILFSEEISKILGEENEKEGISIRSFYTKIDQKYRERFIQGVKDIAQTQKIDNLEIGVHAENGEMVYFSLNAVAIIDEYKIVQKVIGTFLDITERKHAEESLKKSESQLSIAMQIARLGYWEFDVMQGVFTFNDQFYAMLKTTVEEVGGYHLSPDKYSQRFVHADDQAVVALEVEKALTTSDPDYSRQIEHRVTFGNGESGWISVNFYIVKDEKGNTIKTYGVNQDITERKKYEEKIISNQELLLTSEEMGKIGSWEVNFVDLQDWSKNTTTWSDESYRIFGYEPGSVPVSFPFFLEHVLPEDRELITTNFSRLFTPGRVHEEEYRIRSKDGTIKNIHGKFYVKFDEKNVPVKMVGMSQDISTRKKLESELASYNERLKSEIEYQTRELTIANRNLDAFNYSISHDLKTPIRGLEIYMDLLRDTVGNNQESLEYLEHLDGVIIQIKEMIQVLLDFSKYSKAILEKQMIDMEHKINTCISLYTHVPANVQFKIIQTPSLFGDDHLLTHVLANLISNAVKYSSKTSMPVIEISGESNAEHTTYYIKDNGAGFDENLSHKLFKPFSRLHNEDEFEGTGAGLAIVERIISRHGGKIWAESKQGEGATFYFRVPNK